MIHSIKTRVTKHVSDQRVTKEPKPGKGIRVAGVEGRVCSFVEVVRDRLR